jgi:hypothetical protein
VLRRPYTARMSRRGEAAIARALVACVVGGESQPAARLDGVRHAGIVDEFLDRAAYHRVVPYVRRVLLEDADLDEALRFRLVESAVHEAARTMRIQNDLATAPALLDGAAVRWMVVKGPVLAEALYRDPSLRTYADLDLLVAAPDFRRAVEALEADGAELLDRNWELIERERRGQLHFRLRLGTFADVHWHLLNRAAVRRSFSISMPEAFARSRTVRAGGIDVRTLDAVDTLIHVGLHATTSGGDRLIWLADVRASIDAEPPDWPLLVERARAWGAGAPVALALERSRRVLGTPVPDEVIAALYGSRSLRAVGRTLDRAWPPERSSGGSTPAALWSTLLRRGWATTIGAGLERAWRGVANRGRDDEGSHAERPVVVPTGDAETRDRYLRAVTGEASSTG